MRWDVTVVDNTISSGEFRFCSYSQQPVRYAGFEQTGGIIVPELTILLLLAAGIGLDWNAGPGSRSCQRPLSNSSRSSRMRRFVSSAVFWPVRSASS